MTADKWDEIADRVWFRRYGYGDENVGLIGSAAGLLLVDTRATEVHARELIADIRWLTDEPIIGVVNTHGHWDHVFGNAVFEGVPIWGHRSLPAFMAATSEPIRHRLITTEPFSVMEDALRAVRVVPPTHLVDAEQLVSVGGRDVQLRYLGRGHTDGDLIVEVPDCSVTFVGDLVKENGPPGYATATRWTGLRLCGVSSTVSRALSYRGMVTSPDRSFAESFAGQLDVVATLVRSVASGERTAAEAAAESPVHPRAFEQALSRVRTNDQ